MEESLDKLLRKCTVRISVTASHGTGFFVAPGLILTCAHVVKEARERNHATVVYWNRQSYAAQITSFSRGSDLALLQVNLADHPCVLLNQEIEDDDPLKSYGYPDDYPNGDTTTYEWEGWTQTQEQELLKFKEGQVRPGMSGSPLLNKRTGKVCGMVNLTRNRSSDLGGRGIPTSTILTAYPELVKQQEEFHAGNRQWLDLLPMKQQQEDEQFSAPLWAIPFQRNTYFTGREDILQQLHNNLMNSKVAAQAIKGLGGIGKTQIAIEYAYCHRDDYKFVLWANAEISTDGTQQWGTTLDAPANAETPGGLVSDFVAIAGLLELPERDASQPMITVNAVKHWLETHAGWLLILDNADNLKTVWGFLPTGGTGHILLTTRAQATGAIESIDVEEMEPEEGALLLLRRSKIIKPSASLDAAQVIDRAAAIKFVQEVDGLPLALDQAGAYIEETGCSLLGYLDLYKKEGTELRKRRGELSTDHPQPVATTWSLSFQRIEQMNPAAAELLRLCAFLSPDAIPEEIITEGAHTLGPILQPIAGSQFELDRTIGNLLKFSLVSREEKTLSVHRLVQTVLKDEMKEHEQRQWAERAVLAINCVLKTPSKTWQFYQRYFLQSQICAELIEQWDMQFTEGAELLGLGNYLREHAQYSQAERVYVRALTNEENRLGPESLQVASVLYDLAFLYLKKGNYTQAETLYKRTLRIQEKHLEKDAPETARTLNTLADLYCKRGEYTKAEPLLLRARKINEQTSRPKNSDVADVLNTLAKIYRGQKRYDQAESLYQEALTIYREVSGPEHPYVATILGNLGVLFTVQHKYIEAERYYQEALAIQERLQGLEHYERAYTLNNLATLYQLQGKYAEAEPRFRQALKIREQKLGLEHPETAFSLRKLALWYAEQGQYSEAEPFMRRAMEILERMLGSEDSDTIAYRGDYTELLQKMKEEQG